MREEAVDRRGGRYLEAVGRRPATPRARRARSASAEYGTSTSISCSIAYWCRARRPRAPPPGRAT
jgi:hypothetical protein